MSKQNTAKPADNKKKQIILWVVLAIVALNVMWTIMQNKFTPKLDGIKADVASVDARLAKIEKDGLPDVANLRENFEILKVVSTKFSDQIKTLLKAEEDQLKYLEAQVEAQKARIEDLKKLVAE